jgi:hypothetical protein
VLRLVVLGLILLVLGLVLLVLRLVVLGQHLAAIVVPVVPTATEQMRSKERKPKVSNAPHSATNWVRQ